MRICMLAAALVVLTGCATAPAPVLPDVAQPTVREVQVVVTQPCVRDIPQAPEWAADALTPAANEFERVKALLVQRIQAREYIGRLLAVLTACKGA